MKNFWLQKRPKIHQQLNPYAEYYGKWYVIKRSDKLTDLYLHKDGQWRITAFNIDTGRYTAYFDTQKEAEEIIKLIKKHV